MKIGFRHVFKCWKIIFPGCGFFELVLVPIEIIEKKIFERRCVARGVGVIDLKFLVILIVLLDRFIFINCQRVGGERGGCLI